MNSRAAAERQPSQANSQRFQRCLRELESRGQANVLRWWDDLEPSAREHLLGEIESIPWDLVDTLMESHVRHKPTVLPPSDLAPVSVYPATPRDADMERRYREATAIGADLLAAGKVAAFTVAGGQGTRLGFDGPKGAVTITPVREKTLFQLFAETVRAACRRYRAKIPWYIMTNPANHQQTVGFLRDHEFFGLPEDDVILFTQGMLPSFDFDGNLLMTDRHRLALAPDGHGGSLKSLVASGSLEDMQRRGIELISYFQVDNPLVQPFDELFVGLHALTKSEMSSKVVSKIDDFERVGNVCLQDGRATVIEYSNFPDDLATARNADGSRKFNVGSIAIHLLSVSFVDRIIAQNFSLPYHRAEKTVTWIDENGFQRTPPARDPNAVKLETFVFDALPLASNPLFLEVDRTEEFAPVKNATGVDSVESAIKQQIARAARWLETAGVGIPRDAHGDPELALEIAPSYALNVHDVIRKVISPPTLRSGETIYIS